MKVARGITLASGLFLASFALHIVGGATGQGWLFAAAVALIYITATVFPILALALGGLRFDASAASRSAAGIGAVLGYACTLGALWATNGRAFAWWEFPLATILLLGASAVAAFVLVWVRAWRGNRGPDPVRHAGAAR